LVSFAENTDAARAAWVHAWGLIRRQGLSLTLVRERGIMIGKIFKAYDVRATYPDPLNEEAAWKVGYATGIYLQQLNHGKPGTVLVSRDMRPHSPALVQALIQGILAAGMDVTNLGMCDTSFMYFAINHVGAVGGVQTTASHNPIHYNGFKISGPQAKPIGADTGLKEIQKIAEGVGAAVDRSPKGQLSERDLWADYRQHVLSFFTKPQRKLKVFIDACNGMGGKLVPGVFKELPGVEIVPLNFEITGKFVHEPNPLVAANMVPTQEGVRRHGADLGVCFDGDADRCILTDEKGQIIGCDHLTALMTSHFMKQAPGAAVVYDLRSSKVVEETIRNAGGKPIKSRVGHVFIKATLREHDGIFGGELSGHFYFKDNFFTDSGAITFAVVLSILGQSDQTLSQLIAPFQKYPQSGERNFKAQDKQGVMDSLKSEFGKRGATVEELDGVSIDLWDQASGGGGGGGFWFNVRASNTEPLLRLNAEAKDAATLDKLLKELTPKLGTPDAGH
jgi:phosphomannomutase